MTLTETAYWARLAIKYGFAFLIFLILARIVISIGFTIYRSFVPESPPAPTVKFGKIPTLAFPPSKQPLQGQNLNFTLELPEGDLPKTPTILPVFPVAPKNSFLGALDETRKTAGGLGFTKDEQSLSDTIYRFTHARNNSTLDINIITGAFSISSSLFEDKDLLQFNSPTQEAAISTVQSFLSSTDLYPEDFTDDKISATFWRVAGATFVPVGSISEGQFTRVDLFRQDVKLADTPYPVVTTRPGSANVWFVISGTTNPSKQILGGEYHYFFVNYDASSTYPLKSASLAWDELKGGRGVFINLPDSGNIVVRRVYLAYYDSPDFQDFFQPIFVFEGDNFLGYLPAVTSEYYGK